MLLSMIVVKNAISKTFIFLNFHYIHYFSNSFDILKHEWIIKIFTGLFRGAILQSGSSLAAHEYQPSARQYAFQLGRALNGGSDLDNSTELLRLLQQASALDIVKASAKVNEFIKVTITLYIRMVYVENCLNYCSQLVFLNYE